MDAHLPNVYFNQCFTQKTHDIKLTHICLMSTLINAPPRKLAIKTDEHLPNVYLINALPRKLGILNRRTFT